MLWDDQYLYVGAELEEPDVRATLTKHDSVIFHDNDFEVFLKPPGEAPVYFEFEINALNTGWDLYLNKPYREGGKADNSWDIPGLKTAVAIHGTLNDPDTTKTAAGSWRWRFRGAPLRRACRCQDPRSAISGESTSAELSGRRANRRKTTGSGRHKA
jgi:hypothetical protein